jgi:hypothetical protein
MQQDNVIIYGRLKKKFIAKISLEIIKQNNETVVIDILFDRQSVRFCFQIVVISIVTLKIGCFKYFLKN